MGAGPKSVWRAHPYLFGVQTSHKYCGISLVTPRAVQTCHNPCDMSWLHIKKANTCHNPCDMSCPPHSAVQNLTIMVTPFPSATRGTLKKQRKVHQIGATPFLFLQSQHLDEHWLLTCQHRALQVANLQERSAKTKNIFVAPI